MGSNEDHNVNSASEVKPKIFTYGDKSLSDVTFVIGENEFKCHKMGLAMRSSYFKAMFFSGFKEKDQDKVSITADPDAFDQLMQLLYTGRYRTWVRDVYCNTKNNCYKCAEKKKEFGLCDECMPISSVWKKCTVLLKLADQFDLLEYTKEAIEGFFLRSFCKCGAKKDCVRSAVKLIIARVYGMEVFESRSQSTKAALIAALKEIKKVESVDRIFNTDDLLWLLGRE